MYSALTETAWLMRAVPATATTADFSYNNSRNNCSDFDLWLR
jgi:hypothetical protein